MRLSLELLLLSLIPSGSGFTAPKRLSARRAQCSKEQRHSSGYSSFSPLPHSFHLSSNAQSDEMTSYEVDEDEESEQFLHDRPVPFVPLTVSEDSTPINGDKGGRYDAVLSQVGLSLKQTSQIPPKHAISTNDVFCNRELRLGGIRAIGFDMDYTLAQYQQPAFDKLAFDGAKEKLVHALGYPKEVLDFEYDHTRWTRGLIIDTQVSYFRFNAVLIIDSIMYCLLINTILLLYTLCYAGREFSFQSCNVQNNMYLYLQCYPHAK
jgi:hypothetical protein